MIYVNVMFPTIMSLKVKDPETLLFESCVKRRSFRLKRRAVARLSSWTSDGPKLGFITASSGLVALLCVPSRMKGSQQWILEASRAFFLLLPAPLSSSSP